MQFVLNGLCGWLSARLRADKAAAVLQCYFQASLPSPRSNFGVSAVNYMCPGGLGR